MTWTAYLADKGQTNGLNVATLVLTDGQTKVERTGTFSDLDDAALEAFARGEISRLDAAKAAVGKLTYAVGDQLNLVVAAPIVAKPTAEDQARADFFAGYRDLQRLQRLAAAGLIAADDQRILDLQKTLAPQAETYLEQM